MGEAILKTDIKREKTKLYYCGTSPDGYIVVCEAVMSRSGGHKKKKKE